MGGYYIDATLIRHHKSGLSCARHWGDGAKAGQSIKSWGDDTMIRMGGGVFIRSNLSQRDSGNEQKKYSLSSSGVQQSQTEVVELCCPLLGKGKSMVSISLVDLNWQGFSSV